MTSAKESSDVDKIQMEGEKLRKERKGSKDITELPPIGLHKRRRGEPPATLSVKSPQTPSDAEGSSPCTAGPLDEMWNIQDVETTDPEVLCDSMLQRLKNLDDPISRRGKELASRTKETLENLDQLEKLLELLDQFVTLKEHNARLLRRLRDVNHLKRLHNAHKKIDEENERLKDEAKELELINEALDAEFECEYGQAIFDAVLVGGRSMKRTGSKWKSHSRFGGSLLRKQRSRSAGGDESDVSPGTPLRRRSDGIFSKEVEKSKVSNWTRVKAAFKWEKAQWPPATIGGAAAVAAGAMVGAVALAGSSPGSLPNPEPRDSASLTPGSVISLTPNSSCEELRMDPETRRRSCIQDNTFLQAPMQDDSSTSPSPNKLHKSAWLKMRGIIQRDSLKKKSRPKGSPDVIPRRRSFSDGGDSDAPPALTLTIPSSEELESEGPHPVLRKQRSLELGARPPQHRQPRDSKWTRVKRAFLTSASASVPSSPNRHSAFFTDGDTEGISSGCEASGVREEIARDYAALQSRLRREFSDRREKIYAASRPVATEEQLSADFHKKLTEWQRMKGVKQPPPVPARRDLSDDFLKKWDEWKRMKETNSVPAWEEEAKPDEVLVQTSTGLFKFQGISRSFTRKLHEWEKSRGIAPEASTSALLRAAKAKVKVPPTPLTRTQSDGSVAPSVGSRVHASSLSVNDADDLESEFERQLLDGDVCDDYDRKAVLVEVEAEEICTAAPLMAVSPRHTPQKPVYTYGQAEARHLCETSSTVTGTAVLQPNGADSRNIKCKEHPSTAAKSSREQSHDKSRAKIVRQPSIEEDAAFIRKTIEEIEKNSNRFKEEEGVDIYEIQNPSTSKSANRNLKHVDSFKELKNNDEAIDPKRKDTEKNGKKKSKSRARLEREQSKPSESDSEPEVDTVTVEIPRRRKRPKRLSDKPKNPPLHSNSDEEVFVLKLKAPEVRDISPEVIVKTTRKIFSPVVRSGESVPRAVIPLDVEDLNEVRTANKNPSRTEVKKEDYKEKEVIEHKKKSSDDRKEDEKRRPPLPSSPTSQRKLSKETAPSIRIMIQRYNKKINEEGAASGASSGTTSPAVERRRPADMPSGLHIRNNPFLEREVQKSSSASQLPRRDQTSAEKTIPPTDSFEVLKSHSANTLHPKHTKVDNPKSIKKCSMLSEFKEQTRTKQIENNETKRITESVLDNIVEKENGTNYNEHTYPSPVVRQRAEVTTPSRSAEDYGFFERSLQSNLDTKLESGVVVPRLSERAERIRAARERFLSSTPSIRREGTSSASDLRPVDRSSHVSCDSETENQGSPELSLGRSMSTGMVNVDRESWQRVTEGSRRDRPKSRFSLARLAAKLRRKDEKGAVSRLCRQSLLVQLRKQ